MCSKHFVKSRGCTLRPEEVPMLTIYIPTRWTQITLLEYTYSLNSNYLTKISLLFELKSPWHSTENNLNTWKVARTEKDYYLHWKSSFVHLFVFTLGCSNKNWCIASGFHKQLYLMSFSHRSYICTCNSSRYNFHHLELLLCQICQSVSKTDAQVQKWSLLNKTMHVNILNLQNVGWLIFTPLYVFQCMYQTQRTPTYVHVSKYISSSRTFLLPCLILKNTLYRYSSESISAKVTPVIKVGTYNQLQLNDWLWICYGTESTHLVQEIKLAWELCSSWIGLHNSYMNRIRLF